MLAAVVVWIFADNYGTDGSPITYEKWFRDIPITYTSETVLTGRGLMLLEEGTDATVDLKMQGSHWDLALLDSDYIRVTVDLSDVTRSGRADGILHPGELHVPVFQRQDHQDPAEPVAHHLECGGAVPQDGGRPLRDHRQCGGGLLRRRAADQPQRRSRSGATRRTWMPSATPR